MVRGRDVRDFYLRFHLPLTSSLQDRINGIVLSITRATSATYVGSDGLIATAASGVARFGHDPTTFAPIGLLVERSGTNECLHNRDFSNAAWVKSNITALKDETGEDGVANSASSLLATDANGTALQTFTITSGARTVTFGLKRLIGSGDVDITIDNGATWATQTINSSTWTRVKVTQTLANPIIGIRLVTDTDKVAVDYAQLEKAAYATSRIATTTGAVTRNGDVVITTDVDWYNESAGSVYVKFSQPILTAVLAKVFDITDVSTSNRSYMDVEAAGDTRWVIREGADNDADLPGETVVAEQQHFAAATIKGNDIELYSGGSRSGTGDQSATVPSGITQLNVGSHYLGDRQWLNGHIKDFRYYNVRLPNTQLSALTT